MRIQPFAVIMQLSANAGEIEIKHQIRVTVACGMLPDIEVTEQGIEFVTGGYVVIMLQHIQSQTLSEPPRTDKEEKRSASSIRGMNAVLST